MAGWIGTVALGDGMRRIIQDDYFVAADLGAAFNKPSSWVFIPPERLAREAADIGTALGVNMDSPSVMNISKEPWSTITKRFIPGINIWRYPRSTFGRAENCLLHFEGIQRSYADYRLTKRFQNCVLQDGTALSSTCEFIFTTLGIDRPTPVRCHLVVMEQPDAFLQVSLCDSPALGYEEDELFNNFLQSLRYVSAAPA